MSKDKTIDVSETQPSFPSDAPDFVAGKAAQVNIAPLPLTDEEVAEMGRTLTSPTPAAKRLKGKALETAMKERRRLLVARLTSPNAGNLPVEQTAQAKYELRIMDLDQWQPGIKCPRKTPWHEQLISAAKS